MLFDRGAEEDTAQGCDIGVVATPCKGHVAFGWGLVVGRVEVEPAPPRDERGEPRVGSIPVSVSISAIVTTVCLVSCTSRAR